MSNKESVGKTFLVAGVLCVVCSAVVSIAAIGLKDKQNQNIITDKRKNILAAAGAYNETVDVNDLYEKTIEVNYLNLNTGEVSTEAPAQGYDSIVAAKDSKFGELIPAEKDLADIKRRGKISEVYLYKVDGALSKIILPIRGKGLWSTLMGFAAVETDGQTIAGLTFYSHAETPGLGGEIDNPSWKAKFPGKKIYAENGEVALSVIKGSVIPGSAGAEHNVDGLAGATITSRGVSNLLHYWFGEEGFKSYLSKLGGDQ